MPATKTTEEKPKQAAEKTAGSEARQATQSTQSSQTPQRNEGRKQQTRRPRRDDRGSGGRSKPEFDHTVLDIRRVTRVVAGGRRFSFRVALVAGDRRGRVGVGIGKAGDTPLAIEKAFRDAKQNMITVNTTENMSIPCDVKAKYNASRVLMKPSPGKGVIAGSAVRPVIELAGLHDISTKLLSRSKNSLNNARVAIKALEQLPTPKKENSAAAPEKKKEEKK